MRKATPRRPYLSRINDTDSTLNLSQDQSVNELDEKPLERNQSIIIKSNLQNECDNLEITTEEERLENEIKLQNLLLTKETILTNIQEAIYSNRILPIANDLQSHTKQFLELLNQTSIEEKFNDRIRTMQLILNTLHFKGIDGFKTVEDFNEFLLEFESTVKNVIGTKESFNVRALLFTLETNKKCKEVLLQLDSKKRDLLKLIIKHHEKTMLILIEKLEKQLQFQRRMKDVLTCLNCKFKA